jgi:hypothetical protein
MSIKYNQGDKNRGGDLGEHVTAMRELRNALRRVQENLREIIHLVERGVNGRIILQCNLIVNECSGID